MKFRSSSLWLTCVFFLSALTGLGAAEVPRETLSFDAGWRFQKGDPADLTEPLDYASIKAWMLPTGEELKSFNPSPAVRPAGNLGAGASYAKPAFDDSAWRHLDLPHDWGIEGPFSQELEGDTGKLPWAGIAWYRKTFSLPAADAGRRISLELDGTMSYALVWCNGQFVGGWPYGYTSWRVDLTPYVKAGASNVIAIRLDNPPNSSRWYPGAGIYRHVRLVKTAPVHIAPVSTFVTTPSISAQVASVNVAAEVDNTTADPVELQISTKIFEADAEGHPVGAPVVASELLTVRAGKNARSRFSQALAVPSPKLWSLQAPQRYVAEITVLQGGQAVDRVLTPFGIRTIAFTADGGFTLNGVRVPIQGVCNHHDLGALGTAINTRALERQLEILREMGCNAIRTSHNPPAPELLELCDRMGFLVMVEAFDGWLGSKRKGDYSRIFADWHEKDLRAMIRRDRNHPSVILWSIGNEVREQSRPEGWRLAAHLAGLVREEDRTRFVTMGFNNTAAVYNGFQSALDVVGFNYKPAEYPVFHARNPSIAAIGGETASTVSSRGEYYFPVSDDKAQGRADFQVSSYDLYAPRWAFPPDVEFRGLDDAPYIAGEFVWTGFDYFGEPTPYNSDATNLLNFSDPEQRARMAQELAELKKISVPSRSSYFGIIDLAGFPKDRYYLYQARWRPDLPMAHILPHWNWPERIGQVTPVHVYSSGDEAELFLNGQSLGRKKRAPRDYRFRWDDVVYAPGELKVVTYKQGRPWAEAVQRTTGAAEKLTLKADRDALRADGFDLSYVTVTVADREGALVPRSKNDLVFTLTGPGEIVAVDNGDATSLEPFQASHCKAYNGLALVIVRTKAGQSGQITLRAESAGLAYAEISVISR